MIHHSLSNLKFVNRVNYICHLCRNKRVLHLGATDAPNTQEAVESSRLLHFELTAVSQEVIGIDINQEMINWLKDNYNVTNIKYGNIEVYEDYPQQNFDIIIAGEILEHLSNPGKALDCLVYIAQPQTKLIITVPNTYSLKGFLRAVIKSELIHPDHTLYHSPHTIKTLLNRHGFQIDSYFSFVNGGQGILSSITNKLLKFSPQLAEGIGVIGSKIIS